MASRSTNTMAEALQKLMRDVADMKTLPDADLPWLVQLENMIIERLNRPVEMLQRSGQLPPSQPGSAGGPAPQGAGALMGGGLMASAQAPSQDQLARLLATNDVTG